MVLTQSSSLLAGKQDSSAPENITKIAAPIDLDGDIFYSALPDDVLEKAAGSVYLAQHTGGFCPTFYCNKGQPVKKPPSSVQKPKS